MPLPRNVRLLGWASFLNDVASEIVYPLLPKFLIDVLGGDKRILGLVEGIADTAGSLVRLFSGSWSDRLGVRKGFVVGGYFLAAVIRPLMALFTAPWQVIASRGIDRIGKGIRTPARDALIADSTQTDQRGRAFGFNRAMDHAGAAVGPLLAMAFLWLCPGEYRWLFLLTIVPGLAVVLLLAIGLKEQPLASPASKPFSLKLSALPTGFRYYLVVLVIFTLGNSSDAFLLVRASELGTPDWGLPLLWCVFHVAKSAGNAISGRVTDRIGPRPMIIAGWAVYAAIYLLLALATSAWHVWALFLGYALFYALSEPAEKTLVANLVPKEHTGLAFGWFNFAVGIAALPSSVIFGLLYQSHGALAAFGCGAGLALLAAVLLVGVRIKQA